MGMGNNGTRNGSPIKKNKPTLLKGKKKLFSCFNLFLLLIGFHLTCLLIVGLMSDGLDAYAWSPVFLQDVDYLLPHIPTNTTTDDTITVDEVELEEQLEAQVAEEEAAEDLADEVDMEDSLDNTTGIYDYFNERVQHIKEPVVLVVGGSDGSGTRAFVDVLGRLGVPMIVDDGGTMDVHGKQLFAGKGWPPLASAILRELGSKNDYNFEQLSPSLQESCIHEFRELRKSFDYREQDIRQKAANHSVSLATYVKHGYKAPVTMLMVPILQQLYGKLKYLHIVRDGRDVSFSSNQSPVEKFYDYAYASDFMERRKRFDGDLKPVRAMQLWNDWNTGLFNWVQSRSSDENLDYLVLRTEDLLSPSRKFELLLRLADFVGSTATVKDLCCLSRMAVSDMGQSSRGGGGGMWGRWEKGRRMNRFGDMMESKMRFQGFIQEKYGKTTKELTTKEKLEAIRQFRKQKDQFGVGDKDGRAITPYRRERQRDKQRLTKERFFQMKKENFLRRRQLGPPEKEEYPPVGLAAMRQAMVEGIRSGRMQDRDLDTKDLDERARNIVKDRGKRRRQKIRNFDETTSVVFGRRRLFSFFGEDKGNREAESKVEKSKVRSELRNDFQKAMKEGNLKRMEELREVMRQMRGSDRAARERNRGELVKGRYGKWIEMVKDKPELEEKLHKEGQEGLAMFGYEPKRRFMVPAPQAMLDQCPETIECGTR